MTAPKRPIMRYHGGKWRLAPWVLSHFPPHRCYVEPFGGAASVLIRKSRAYAEVYNDLDGDIVNLFRVLRDAGQCARLIQQLHLTPYAREEFVQAFENCDDSLERARRTLIRAEMGFGSAGSTKAHTGFRIDTRRKYGTAQDLWVRFPTGLAQVCERLQGVMLENRPAIDIIRQHDSADALIYCDPPYMLGTRYKGAKHGRYYAHEMLDADHAQLLDVLRNSKSMVILSGYASAAYADGLPGWVSTSTRARISGARGTSLRTEHLWMNPACLSALERSGLFGEVAA